MANKLWEWFTGRILVLAGEFCNLQSSPTSISALPGLPGAGMEIDRTIGLSSYLNPVICKTRYREEVHALYMASRRSCE
jgi:hypothetical protein